MEIRVPIRTRGFIATKRPYPIAASTSGGVAVICVLTTDTEEIRKWTFGLLQGIPFDDLDDGLDDGDCISLARGHEPSVRDVNSADQEIESVLEEIRSMVDSGGALEDICIVARTGRILDNYKTRLANEGHRVYEIKRRNVDNRNQPGIRIATMHRVKGLEFEHVFVVSANRRTIPLAQAAENGDPVARDAALAAERCLLYVALKGEANSLLDELWGHVRVY